MERNSVVPMKRRDSRNEMKSLAESNLKENMLMKNAMVIEIDNSIKNLMTTGINLKKLIIFVKLTNLYRVRQ